jgi:cation transport ATPase
MFFGTALGKAVIVVGFVAFMGFAGSGFILLRAAWAQYRSGQSDMNPLACIAVATAALLLLAHLRALALP